MATTTIRPSNKPGKLSSKFGAAFAAFENKSGESNVPAAFRSANKRRIKKPLPEQPEGKTTIKTNNRYSRPQRKSLNTEKATNSTTDNKQKDHAHHQSSTQTNHAAETSSTHNESTRRNFRVPSTLANRAKLFETNNKVSNGDDNLKNPRQGLRQTTPSLSEKPVLSKHKSVEFAPDPAVDVHKEEDETVTEATTTTDANDDSDAAEWDAVGIIECVPKDTTHSTIGGYSDCDDDDDEEYEEFWEEETLPSTFAEDDDESWEEETIEDELVLDEEEEQC